MPSTALLLLAATLSSAKPPEGIVYSSLTAGRLNPLGLSSLFEIGAQFRLSDSDSILFEDTFAGIYFTPYVAPAFLNPGISVKVQPIAVLKLEARYSWIRYLGSSKLLQSFASPSADFSDSRIEARADEDRNYSTEGVNATLAAELRAKVGPIAARSKLQMTFHDMELQATDRVWFDQITDLLAPGTGWTLTNDLDVLCQLPIGESSMFMAGARYAIGAPLYSSRDFAPGEPQTHENGPNHRVGPMFVFTFFDEPGAAFNKPSLIAIVNWHLAHRFRTGEDTSGAIPYVAVAFAFTGEVWPSYFSRTE